MLKALLYADLLFNIAQNQLIKELTFSVLKDRFNFESFYKENYTRFYYFTFQFLSDEEKSRDIVCDAFEFAWKKRKEFDENGMRSFVYTYLRNKSIDHLRHLKVQEKYVEFFQQMYNEDTSDEYDMLEEQIAEMQKLIGEFAPRTQFILKKCYIQKMKYKDVAEELDISVSAVKKQISNALKILRLKMVKNA